MSESRQKVMALSTGISLTIVVILYVAAYWPVFRNLYEAWMENGNNSHGIFVPFISCYFLWRIRHKLQMEEIKPSGVGLGAVVGSLASYVICYAGGIEIFQRLTIVTTLAALVMFNLGWRYLKAVWFPIFFLVFMIPLPVSLVNQVSFPLKLLATKTAAFIIGGISIPVLQQGNMLYFSNTALEVAEACSGLRSLYAYVMLGVLFAHLAKTSTTRKAVFVLFTIPLALTMNIIRVTVTGVLAYLFGPRLARGFLHEFSGLLLFAVGFLLMAFVYRILERRRLSSILCKAK